MPDSSVRPLGEPPQCNCLYGKGLDNGGDPDNCPVHKGTADRNAVRRNPPEPTDVMIRASLDATYPSHVQEEMATSELAKGSRLWEHHRRVLRAALRAVDFGRATEEPSNG
jgi:hypothetical protein